MCVAICVLLAIVFVLSKGSADVDFATQQTQQQQQQSLNKNQLRTVDTAPTFTTTYAPLETATSAPEFSTYTGPDTSTVATNSESTVPATSTYSATTTTEPEKDCNCPTTTSTSSEIDDPNALMAKLREDALSKTPPHIIECDAAEAGESQDACHLPKQQRFAALGQKGATLWMTGCSGAGKTTIATALEDLLVKNYGKHVYRLDGDNLRTGINRDLTFTESDRAESVRRTGELATLFSDAGVITLVGLISPYRGDRDLVRKRHEDQGIPFYEIFLDVPIDELFNRDPKGQYARVKSGELKHFTCIDDPYEEPLDPEITLKTHELQIEESVNILLKRLDRDGILIGPPKVTPPGLPNPDGDLLIDLQVPAEEAPSKQAEAETLPKVLLTDIDLNWLQTIAEGWAAPLTGFMREGMLLETLHFNSVLVDPFNVTGNQNRLLGPTNFEHFNVNRPNHRVSMPIPLTLSLTEFTKASIEHSGKQDVALVTRMGKTIAIMRNVEVYANRKEEIVTRMYGVIDMGHPYIKNIYSGGEYLIGGEIELLERIKYNDGLDKWRKTVKELLQEFEDKGADTVYAFQTRNPTHAGHAYLMKSAGEDLKKQGYKKPILWLSPLGGWTKEDDVPLDVRVNQHEKVLEAGTGHPGGLDPDSTVMAIWPAPMVYAGPTEVEFHAKSRRCAGASYFVVGRDPAGMKGSMEAVAHQDDDLYDGNHGRYVLQNSPGIENMKMLSFVKVMYDISDNVMKVPDASRMQDFISISGTKMRLLARNGAVPCSATDIPADLIEANCIPSGFMVPDGWNLVVDYYKNIENTTRFIPWSQPHVEAPADERTSSVGSFGFSTFALSSLDFPSFWHDVDYKPSTTEHGIINMITEIPMHMASKMEVDKSMPGNPIRQDTNKDGSPRYLTYGTTFFNYGLVPQTWEDPDLKSGNYGGDNDPIDVMELGSRPLKMGSITPCRVIGSLELIDEGETDHKIMCISLSDADASRIYNMDDLERVKPGYLTQILDWWKNYKTSDGKAVNSLASDIPRTVDQALEVLNEVHERWRKLCGHDGTRRSSLSSQTNEFFLASPGCRAP
jgi:3'-phosphoadenosine 5'-phosphosulfate synthase